MGVLEIDERVFEIASKIDHTLLKPDTMKKDIDRLCEEAVEYGFAAVCIPPLFIQDAVKNLKETDVKVATVIGFPFGYNATAAKVEEAKNAFDNGADEIDMVINIAAVKNGRWSFVKNDIQSVTTIAHLHNKIVKVIIETGMFSDEDIKKACELCSEAEADYVKTSTGFNGEGASVEMIGKLRSYLPSSIRIKASGGIQTMDFAEKLIKAGADRLGSSSGVKIVS